MELEIHDLIKWFEITNERIQQHKDYLTGLDQPIGDGDHGINMARGYQEAVTKLSQAEYQEPSEVLRDASMALLSKVGGASGPLYGTAFLKMSLAVKGLETINAASLVNGLSAALLGIKQRGKAEAGEKTLVDVWGPVVDYISSEESNLRAEDLTSQARMAMERTKEMMATKGRASYFKEKSIGHIDPGSASSYYVFASLAEVWKEKT
ncbi:dihydroxyacetone kinase subunit DhaL [Ornithinibacillus xuwenensis]|jgi:phosphoenolpyruvate---glycerone phosphotransferase subunit DhaL|uniref:Dihydroxyacetone kinase subunit DhaL n=1 Tax=Ornithinibacillus xuwenensis TaxID=3144668 RepID=A0ABU9XJX5_9BACI